MAKREIAILMQNKAALVHPQTPLLLKLSLNHMMLLSGAL